jgi:hypothetical protein
MEWTIRLEAKTGWGEVETVELVSIIRPVLAATADLRQCVLRGDRCSRRQASGSETVQNLGGERSR